MRFAASYVDSPPIFNIRCAGYRSLNVSLDMLVSQSRQQLLCNSCGYSCYVTAVGATNGRPIAPLTILLTKKHAVSVLY
jgi:hypothetical protein